MLSQKFLSVVCAVLRDRDRDLRDRDILRFLFRHDVDDVDDVDVLPQVNSL